MCHIVVAPLTQTIFLRHIVLCISPHSLFWKQWRELRGTSEHRWRNKGGWGAIPPLHPQIFSWFYFHNYFGHTQTPNCMALLYYFETHSLNIINQPLHAHKKLFYLLLWHISPLEQLHQNLHSVDSSIVHYLLYWLVRHLVYLLLTLPCWESFLVMFFPAYSG